MENTKIQRAPKPPMFTINGQPISGACWGKVLNCVRGDKELAARIFYRAKARNAANIMAWIGEGLKRIDNKTPYALMSCADEMDNPEAVRSWIDSMIYKITPAKINDAMKEFAYSILKGAA